jgi:CubicO group peptidase (beta-lactamase class C family)
VMAFAWCVFHGVALASPPTDPDAVVRGPLAARIDSFMTAAARLGMEGTLLVEKDGAVILNKGYGVANRQTGAPATIHTPYLAGSLSKQFTAAAIYKLQEQRRLSVGDPLSRWFPDAPADKRGITLDQLLHHTSGLPYQFAGGLFDSLSRDSLAREILGYPLSSSPGERYQYSNPGYNLLGLVIERASGARFDEYLRAAILKPARMTETGFVDEPARWVGARLTPSYSGQDPDDPPLLSARTASRSMGDGSVVTTTGDLWKWERALRANTVLDTSSTRALFTPGPASGTNSRYASGWQVVRSQRGTTVIMHEGDIGGFNADMRRLVDEGATIVFLSNSRVGGRGYREVIPISVTRLLFGPQPELPPRPAPLARSDLDRYGGRWEVSPGAWVDGRIEGGAVRLTASSQASISALAGSDSLARSREAALNLAAAGVADTLLHAGGSALDARFNPALVSEAHAYFFAFWKGVADSLGDGVRVDVLGTQSATAVGGRTYVRLAGSRGARVLSLDWVSGLLIGTEPVPAGGLELEFMPESASTLARYDLWAGRVVRIRRTS